MPSMDASMTGTSVASTSPATSLVVADWGWLRARRGDKLPDGKGYVIPDVLFHEVIGVYKIDPMKGTAFARKLMDIVRANPKRFWVGLYWDALSRMESTPDAVLDATHIISHDLSAGLRDFALIVGSDIGLRLAEFVDYPESDYERRRSQFIRLCEDWTAWILERQPEELKQMRGDVRAQTEWIQRPDQVVELVVRNSRRFDEPPWRAALSCFPDRLAAGRWARIIIWFALMRSLAPESNQHEFENNWDDAHYAFLGSYTAQIATYDRGLRRLVRAVFPSVAVVCSSL